MKRVVITGFGVLSSLGTSKEAVRDSLYEARSGIRFQPAYEKQGLRSQIAGSVDINLQEHIDRKHFRFMGDAAAYAYLALREAIEDAGLTPELTSSERTGLVAGSGGGSTSNEIEGVDTLRAKGIRRVSPFFTPRMMGSTVSANLSTAYRIKGPSYSINSACSTSSHCIGHAMELIQLGKQDIVFAGGAEEEHWCFCMFFDAMRAASTRFNDTPESACRPYDKNRDGLVIAGGGGMLVLEELEHAKNRGAHIYAELTGYGATSDGADMVAPSGEGAVRCMEMALQGSTKTVGYVNTHGTATPVGDIVELRAIKDVFGKDMPYISSTKALSGHSLGATGAQELIYCLLMLQNDFVTKSANIEELDPEAEGYPIAMERKDDTGLEAIMSNSFGFGGTNASLVIEKFTD